VSEHSPGPFFVKRDSWGHCRVYDADGQLVTEVDKFVRQQDRATDRRLEANVALMVSAADTWEFFARMYRAAMSTRDPQALKDEINAIATEAAPLYGAVEHGHVPWWLENTYVEAKRGNELCQVCGQRPRRNQASDQSEGCTEAARQSRKAPPDA